MHIGFPWYLNWKEELSKLSPINRDMMKFHTLFIALLCLMLGLLSLTLGEDLISTQLGKKISIGMGVFWSIRAVIQFVGYSSKIWRGKVLETTLHVFFSAFWVYMSVVYLKVGLS